MVFTVTALAITVALFVGVLVMLEVGKRVGARRLAQDPDGAQRGTGAVDGAVYALLGLLIAFTFSSAASRFDERRALIVQESNDIGTAYLRLDLLPAAAQPALRDQFKRYVDSRLETYRKLPDVDAANAEFLRSKALQAAIWAKAVAATRMADAPPSATMLLLPALNQMIDITSTRSMAALMHPPRVIYVLLFVLAMVASLFAGYGMAGSRSSSWMHTIGFAAVMAAAINVIIDLEYPRLGFIRVDDFDRALVDVRNGM